VATDKRARQRANRQAKIEREVQDEKRGERRRYVFLGSLAAVVVIAILAAVALSGGDDETAAEDDTSATTAPPDDAGTDPGTDDASGTDDGSGTDGAEPLPCPAEDGSSAPVLEFPAAPPDCLVDGATYRAVLETSMGRMVAELDAEAAPVSVNNFVYLARYGYYDGSTFHRVIENFVIQGGDPTGDPPGTGGPGYTIGEEPPEAGGYALGSLAMAKRTPPNTTGAQFFIITGPDGEALPNQYSLFGQLTEGLDVAEAIQVVETEAGDRPVDDVVIESVTIEQS
jgi:cyclophilin family peptidyl-prolyl cis-trans isomerase